VRALARDRLIAGEHPYAGVVGKVGKGKFGHRESGFRAEIEVCFTGICGPVRGHRLRIPT
jgi:hypothetical protein